MRTFTCETQKTLSTISPFVQTLHASQKTSQMRSSQASCSGFISTDRRQVTLPAPGTERFCGAKPELRQLY